MRTFINAFESLLDWIFIIVDTAFWGTLSLLSITVSPSGNLSHQCMRWWSITILWFCRIRVSVDGREKIDTEAIQIFAANHQSFFDVWVLNKIIPVRYGWVIKKEIGRIPFLGMHMRINGYISLDRGNSDQARAGMEEAARQIREGKRIMIFPEGTRSLDGKMRPFKKGLFHLCLKTSIPIVPIYISGTGPILRPGSFLIHRAPVHVTIGEPLDTQGYGEDSIDVIMGDLRERMIGLEETKGFSEQPVL